jgi:hypothetical protein
MLAYHRVREAIASDMVSFYHIDGNKNPADIMSKLWGFQQVWPQLKALLFWHGETKDISDEIATKSHVLNRGECYDTNYSDVLSSERIILVNTSYSIKHLNEYIWLF